MFEFNYMELLPLTYAISSFIIWYTIPKVKKFRGLWYSLGLYMFFIYVYYLSRMMKLNSVFIQDLLLLMGGFFLVAFSILFFETDELKKE
ncbi:MAG: hypothetical protein ABEK17_04970 [Candidatus Aenigmatarchaeota archaeon]